MEGRLGRSINRVKEKGPVDRGRRATGQPPEALEPWPTVEEMRQRAVKLAPEWARRRRELQKLTATTPEIEQLRMR